MVKYETKDIIVYGSRTNNHFVIGTENEHIEIRNNQVITCWGADLTSVDDVIDYIKHQYNTDVSEVIK